MVSFDKHEVHIDGPLPLARLARVVVNNLKTTTCVVLHESQNFGAVCVVRPVIMISHKFGQMREVALCDTIEDKVRVVCVPGVLRIVIAIQFDKNVYIFALRRAWRVKMQQRAIITTSPRMYAEW